MTTSYWNVSRAHVLVAALFSFALQASELFPARVKQTTDIMFSPVLFRLVSAIKLYLLGLKVLVIQLFSKRFELPGWFSLVAGRV